jgi:hypothetical protein
MALAAFLWRPVAEDESIWSADPDPEHHLSAWRGERGWDWHVLDPKGRRIVQGWAEPSLDAAKIRAEQCLAAYRQARRGR